jgi:hypothetical protein
MFQKVMIMILLMQTLTEVSLNPYQKKNILLSFLFLASLQPSQKFYGEPTGRSRSPNRELGARHGAFMCHWS